MSIDVERLVEDAQALKARIVESQAQIEFHQDQIKTCRAQLKLINPLIALRDGDPVEIPELDMRNANGKRKPALGSDEALRASAAKARRKPVKRNAKRKPTAPGAKWPVYPDKCLMPARFHRADQEVQHIGKGLCNAHSQRLRLGAFDVEEMTEYISRCQAWADRKGFDLPDEPLRGLDKARS